MLRGAGVLRTDVGILIIEVGIGMGKPLLSARLVGEDGRDGGAVLEILLGVEIVGAGCERQACADSRHQEYIVSRFHYYNRIKFVRD